MHERHKTKKPENSRMPDIGGKFKFLEDSKMKTKSKLLTGAAAALSLLALSATGVLAQISGESGPLFHCKSGTVVSTGSGYAYPHTYLDTTLSTIVAGQRTVTLTCETPADLFVLDATEIGGRAFLIPATPDKDGIYAAALTALADDKKVEYWLSSTAKSVRYRSASPPYKQSWIRVLNVVGP
jgi:hypothetical protein